MKKICMLVCLSLWLVSCASSEKTTSESSDKKTEKKEAPKAKEELEEM